MSRGAVRGSSLAAWITIALAVACTGDDRDPVDAGADRAGDVPVDMTVAPPTDSGRDDGTDAPGCGEPGEPCCQQSACGGDGCCVAGTCVALGTTCAQQQVTRGTCGRGICERCGRLGEDCCPFLAGGCLEGTCYTDRICESCGGPGQRCCQAAPGRQACTSGLTCGGLAAGRCGACGGPGEPCCPPVAPVCDDQSLVCSGGRCQAADAGACDGPACGG